MKKINYQYTYIYNDLKEPTLSGLIKDTTKILKNANMYNIYEFKYVHIYKINENNKLGYLKTVDLSNCDIKDIKSVKPFNYRIAY